MTNISQKSANKATILIFMTILLSSVASANSAPVLNSVVGGAKEKKPFDSLLIGYWDMDDWNGTYVFDKTSNINDAEILGANRSYGKLGWGMIFDGVDDKLSKGTGTGTSLFSTQMTYLMWIKGNAVANGGILGDFNDYHLNQANDFGILSSKLWLDWYSTGNVQNILTGNAVLVADRWYFVGFTIKNGEQKLYIDGVLDNSASVAADPISSTQRIQIGTGYISGTQRYFDGIIDEVKIYNRTLSADEIANHYSQGIGTGNITTQTPLAVSVNSSSDADNDVLFTAVDWYKDGVLNATTGKPDDNGTVLFMTFDKKNSSVIEDYSVQNNDGTITGATFANDSAMGLGAYNFDGVDDKVDAVDAGSMTSLSSAEMTYTAWVKGNAVANDGIFGDFNRYQLNQANDFGLLSSKLWMDWYSTGPTQNIMIGTAILSVDTWYFVGFTIKNGEQKLYINGIVDKSASVAADPLLGTGTVGIGRGYINGVNRRFNGTIDEARIYNRSLSESEIRQRYWAGARKGLTLNHSQTKKNELWNATVTLYDNSTTSSTPINFSFGTIVSCGYLAEEGNWNIDGEDGCVLDSNYNLGSNNVIIDGEGTFRFNGFNITNYGTIVMRGTSATNRLTVTCDTGCFKD